MFARTRTGQRKALAGTIGITLGLILASATRTGELPAFSPVIALAVLVLLAIGLVVERFSERLGTDESTGHPYRLDPETRDRAIRCAAISLAVALSLRWLYAWDDEPGIDALMGTAVGWGILYLVLLAGDVYLATRRSSQK